HDTRIRALRLQRREESTQSRGLVSRPRRVLKSDLVRRHFFIAAESLDEGLLDHTVDHDTDQADERGGLREGRPRDLRPPGEYRLALLVLDRLAVVLQRDVPDFVTEHARELGFV